MTAVERITLHVPFRERSRPWNDILVSEFGVVEVVRVRTNSPAWSGTARACRTTPGPGPPTRAPPALWSATLPS
ncbi:hypothetical protein [Nonomuraea recticatena]|uniref:hypothetical protein n=1 Tax=Nonomuraea recticatena TaxID=46178 RepID=UPI00361BA6EE